MNRLMLGAAMIALLTSPVVSAQPGNQRSTRSESQQQRENRQWQAQVRSSDNGQRRGWGRDRGNTARWGRGQQMGYNDWRNARRINYRRYNLRQPPRGYEWRRSNDRFIMASTANGVIISVILSNRR